ncbi:MAG: Ig-like domain-containing protein [Bacteroidia bacterium]|nr:Ig-like domain-containing protein [Bacteroidia bacterium]
MRGTNLLLSLYIGMLAVAGLSSCASMMPLSGGDRDMTPPKVTDQQPQNKTLNFTGKEIKIEFDEFIQVRDLQNQLLITPRLKTDPDVSVNGKTLSLKFKETLQPNTTYNINFGSAVSDNHEGNVFTGLAVIFSTGAALDSLSVYGKIADAYTLKPATEVSVFVYENGSDSCMFKSKPDYLGKTDKQGNYVINYIKPGKYKIVAVADKNKNLLYDPATESVGNWYQTDLNAAKQTDFSVFNEKPTQFFIKRTSNPYYGKTVFAFNVPSDSISIKIPEKNKERIKTLLSAANDTLTVFYKKGEADTIPLILFTNNKILDTIQLAIATDERYETDLKAKKLSPKIKRAVGADTGSVNSFVFDMPLLSAANSDKIRIIAEKDTFLIKGNLIVQGNTVFLNTDSYKRSGKARLILFPGAVTGFNNVANDTIIFLFEVVAKENQGTINLNVELPDDSAYVLELINEKGNVQAVFNSNKVQKSGGDAKILLKQNIQRLNPGNYSLRLIKDRDKNLKWTSGDLLLNRKPETVYYYNKPINLLADWEINIDWKVQE